MISANVAAAVVLLGMSQRAFADLLGVSESAISEWISGTKEPTLERAYNLARHLGLTVDELAADELPALGAALGYAIPDFGEGLRAALGHRGKGISWLSVESGVSRSTIHAWLRGRVPRLPQAFAVAHALGVGVSDLCDGASTSGPSTSSPASTSSPSTSSPGSAEAKP
jgi:transcriptional regulator with XRE-family HTH domain